MRKIKWGNVFKALVLIGSLGYVGYITFMLIIYPYITSYCLTLGWLGVALLVISFITIGVITNDFLEELENA